MKKLIRSGTWALVVGVFGFYLLMTNPNGGTFYEPRFEGDTAVTTQPVATADIAKAAPDFALQNLQGETIKLSDFRGKKVVINFWTTWCPPCQDEIPELQAFYDEFIRDHPDVVLIGLNLTKEDYGETHIKQFIKDIDMTFPNVLDPDGDAQKKYGIMTIPTTFIVDEQGKVLQKILGPITKERLIEEVTR